MNGIPYVLVPGIHGDPNMPNVLLQIP
jgi:hypothetical protein